MKIAKTSDRFEISYDTYKIFISPLKYEHKLEILESIKVDGGVEYSDVKKQAFLAIKYGVKSIEGFQGYDDQDYKVSFDSNGNLTDDCTSEVLEALSQIRINENSALLPVFNFLTGNKSKLSGVSIKINGKEIDLGNG